MAKDVNWWFDQYGESHQDPVNTLIHWICVPLIFWSVLALLSLVRLDFLWPGAPEAVEPYLHLGTFIVILGSVFYFSLSITLALGMLVICSFCLWSITWFQAHVSLALWIFALSLFVLAWMGQFIGHKIEGKKPSFLTDLVFLLIGPMWLMGKLYRKAGIAY